MISQEEIDMIIRSYELPPQVAEYARNRAEFLIKYDFIWTFEEIYAAIDKAVSEKVHDYTNPSGKHLNMWSLRRNEGQKPVPVMPDIGEEDVVLPNKLSAKRIESLMRDAGEEKAAEMIEQLFSGKSGGAFIHLPPDELLHRAKEAAQRISIISERYSIDGRVIMPAREVVRVDLGRRKVVFRKRDFHGNPFKFYQDHPEVYGELSRGQINTIDSSLYQQLRVKGHIGKIPKTKKPHRDFGDPLAYLKENADKYGGMSRGELQLADSSLYNALLRAGQIVFLPRKRRAIGDPLTYFRSHPEYKDLSRPDLAEKDWPLYVLLSRSGQLDLAIPENMGQK